jgi:CRISPR-associated protein Cmr3
MSKYLISLTPIDHFFFGGENTFSRNRAKNKKKSEMTDEEKELKEFDDQFSSYIIKSNMFPQQTSLLGMLRFLLLKNSPCFENNKIKKECRDKVKELIGKQSFCANESRNFGKITTIFPCFIQREQGGSGWKNYLPAPKDFGFDMISFQDEKSAYFNLQDKVTAPVISGYNAKKGIQSVFINSGNETLKESDIFIEDHRIGINRDITTGKTGDKDESGFFKQVFYRFKNEEKVKFRFAFYADIDERLPQKDIVTLGGDNSQFILETEIQDGKADAILERYRQKINFENCYAKLVLLSDAHIERDKIGNCLFSINDTVPFRFLQSSIQTQNYYKFNRSADNLIRNETKINLYQRGSVFYFDDENRCKSFKEALESTKSDFHKIGYSHFITILR